MITGIVNAALEATLPLRVQDASGRTQQIDAVIDTGFNGFLTLPPTRIASLGLPWLCRQQGLLADGSVQVFDVFMATMIWDGQARAVEVESIDAAPLAGMELLHKHDLRIQVIAGGDVTIAALP